MLNTRKNKPDPAAVMQAVEARNAMGTIIYTAPADEKTPGDADSEFGELQIRQGSRKNAIIITLIALAVLPAAIASTTNDGLKATTNCILMLVGLYAAYIAIAITILVIQSKTYYVNYYEKGMVVSTLFRKARFTYNDIMDIKKSITSAGGAANGVESFTLTIKNQANVTISGMAYKYANWHMTTLLENLTVNGEPIDLLANIPSSK